MNTVFFLFVEKDLINVVFVVFDVFDTIPNMLNWIVGLYIVLEKLCVCVLKKYFFFLNELLISGSTVLSYYHYFERSDFNFFLREG